VAALIREALNADGMSLTVFTGGQSKVGIGLTGTWVGTVKFFASVDGINFIPVYLTPFASGTTVLSTTATGNWESACLNYVAFKATFTRTSGTAIVTMAASVDASYQSAFLAASSVFVSQSIASGAANAITQAAQANRAWRLRTCVVGYSTAASSVALLTVSDGGSSTLWETYVPVGATGLIGTFQVPLPADPNIPGLTGGGIVGTVGSSMVVTLAAPGGSTVSKLNCEFIPA
jgi:hypothetical protein